MPMLRTPGLAATQIVPFVSEAVLSTEREVTYEAGDWLAPGVGVPKIEFRIPIAPGGGLVRVATKRGPLGEIQWATLQPGRMDGMLEFLTYGYGFDTRMADNDDGPWETRGMNAMRAQQTVTLDRAWSFHRPLLTTDANFDLVINSPDWVANGNSLTTIDTAVKAIQSATGASRDKISVGLFGDAAYHAYADALFVERRTAAQQGFAYPELNDLARYWKVGEVREFHEVYKATDSGDAVDLYPAHAVVFYKPPGDPKNGNARWASTYYHNDYGLEGQALEDIPVPIASGVITPWETAISVVVHKTTSAVLIKTP